MQGTALTSFGQWLRQRRKALDLTQEDLAERVGCSDVTIRKIEAGVRRPSKQIAELLVSCLKIPAEEQEALVTFARGGLLAGTALSLTPQSHATGAGSTAQPTPNNLPSQITPLIGREDAIRNVRERLLRKELRLLTLTGPPGIGKTSVGIHVAADLLDHFQDGVFFVPLAPISDPNLVTAVIARVFGLTDSGLRPLLQSLTAALGDKQLLLLLDNFEQVVEAAPVVARVLEASPRVKVLVTSREPLHIRGENVFPLPTLPLPDLSLTPTASAVLDNPAVRLFLERAQATNPDFTLNDENAESVASICARLDGLPLAIELAAARVRLFSPQEIDKRLVSRLTLLTGGPRDLPGRQQTLRSAIDWSFGLLNRGEQCLFARVSAFVGGAAFPAIEAVCNALGDLPMELPDMIESLLDKNLLKQTRAVDGESRFTMLETIREYALELLEESDEGEEIRRLHAQYYLALAEAAESELRSQNQLIWLDKLEAEHNNLRAVFDWAERSGEIETGLQLAGALIFFWKTRGHFIEGRQKTEWLLSRPEAAGATPGRAKALLAASRLARDQGDYSHAQAHAEESQAIWRELGDKEGVARSLHALAIVMSDKGDNATAFALGEKALAISRELGDKSMIAEGMTHSLGLSLYREGDYERAEVLLRESLELFQELGNKEGVALASIILALIPIQLGDYQTASELAKASLALFHELDEKRRIGRCFGELARIAYGLGEVERAVRLFAASAAVLDSIGASMVPATEAEWEPYIEATRKELGEGHFREVWGEGWSMALEDAIGYALT